jgi:hypothetical protein
MKIGVVTSTVFGPGTTLGVWLQNAFKSGLSGTWSGVTFDIKEVKGKYDADGGGPHAHQELYQEMGKVKGDVIIAAGGLVSAHAAVKEKIKKPFLVLLGHTPDFTLDPTDANYAYRGGVSLDTVGQNNKRNAHTCNQFGLLPNQVCLIFNPKGRMHGAEQNAWTAQGWPAEPVRANDVSEFAKTFTRAKTKATAVVVSADPFFTSQMDDFVNAANDSNLNVCYPFEAYKNAQTKPASGRSMWFGPDLAAAYKLLGQKASAILDALNSHQPAPFTNLDMMSPGGPAPF